MLPFALLALALFWVYLFPSFLLTGKDGFAACVFLVEFVACVKRNEEETGKKKDIMMMGL